MAVQYPRLLEILHHRLNPTCRFKELPQVQKNPKILNTGNQSQHRWNKSWQWNILNYLKYCIINIKLFSDIKKIINSQLSNNKIIFILMN